MISRRTLLTGAATTLALASCSNFNQVLGQVASDASTIANGLGAAFSNIGALNIPGLTPDKMQIIGLAIAGLKAVSTALSGVGNTTAAQPLVQQLETDLNTIVAACAGLPLPPPIPEALGAAAVLLPVIEAAVSLAVTNLAVKPTARRMSPADARAFLSRL